MYRFTPGRSVMRGFLPFLGVCVVFMIMFSSSAWSSATVTVTRNAPDHYTPGQPVYVTLDVQVTGSPKLGLAISEYAPWAFDPYDSTNDPIPADFDTEGYIYWEFAPVQDHYTIKYAVLPPDDARDAEVFGGNAVLLLDESGNSYVTTISGDQIIYGPDGGDVSATREMSKDTYQNVGDQIDLSIVLESSNRPRSVTVEETYDALVFQLQGNSVSPPAASTTVDGNVGKIRWELNNFRGMGEPATVGYRLQVKVKSTSASFFEGKWINTVGDTGLVLGPNVISPVSSAQPTPTPDPGLECNRTFLARPKVYRPGQPLNVQLAFKTPVGMRSLTIVDRFPEGWTFNSYQASTPPFSQVTAGRVATWFYSSSSKIDDVTITYSVTPPTDAMGAQMFSGTWAFQRNTLLDVVEYYVTTGDYVISDGLFDVIPDFIPVVRELPAQYEQGKTVDVALTYDVNEASPPMELTITENVPSGWTLISADPPTSVTTTKSLTWKIPYDQQARYVIDGGITYRLRVPVDEQGTETFNGSYTATSGVAPIAGVVTGDRQIGGDLGGCPEFHDIGGGNLEDQGKIYYSELLALYNRIVAGSEEAEILFCFQKQWDDKDPLLVFTPTQTAKATNTPTSLPGVTSTPTPIPPTNTPTSVPPTNTPTPTQTPTLSNTFDMADYFPLSANSSWTFVGMPEEGGTLEDNFTWTQNGTRTIGSNTATILTTTTVEPTDDRNGDQDFWFVDANGNLYYNGYHMAKARQVQIPPFTVTIPAQDIIVNPPLLVGGRGQTLGSTPVTSSGSSTLQTSIGNRSITVNMSITYDRFDATVATPLGQFTNGLHMTMRLNGSLSGINIPFKNSEFWLKKDIGLIKQDQNASPDQAQVQGLQSGQVAGQPIVTQ